MAVDSHAQGRQARAKKGSKWFRLRKKQHPKYTSRTPQRVQLDRGDARLTKTEWHPPFFYAVRPVYDMGFDASGIYNRDESRFFRQLITNLGAKRVINKHGCKDVYRRRGYRREHMTRIACIRADGIGTLPLTLILKTKKVCGDWFPSSRTLVVLLGNGTGWSTAANFQTYLERVFQHYTRCSHTDNGRVVLLVDGQRRT